jgi:hypothetical protein
MTTTVPVLPDFSGAVPPEERFWQHYSPHGELPLSGVGSLVLHLVIIGMMLFWACYLALFFTRPPAAIPVEPVQLVEGPGTESGPGGNGVVGPNRKKDIWEDEGGRKDEGPPQEIQALPEQRPLLLPPRPTEENTRVIFERRADASPEGLAALRELQREVDRLRDHPREGVRDQTGRSGNKDTGGRPGPRGVGQDGLGQGGAGQGGSGAGRKLTEQEKRRLRWSLHFNTRNGQEYLAQLRGLGAILAIPVQEGYPTRYAVIRDLWRRSVQPREEDISLIRRISWTDDNPGSVVQVMQALGLALQPRYFTVFLPAGLEQQLAELEKQHLQKDHPGLTVDGIEETHFQVVRVGGRYEPRFVSLKLKPAGKRPARP